MLEMLKNVVSKVDLLIINSGKNHDRKSELFGKNDVFDRKFTKMSLEQCFDKDVIKMNKYKVNRNGNTERWVLNKKPYENTLSKCSKNHRSSVDRNSNLSNLDNRNTKLHTTIDVANDLD